MSEPYSYSKHFERLKEVNLVADFRARVKELRSGKDGLNSQDAENKAWEEFSPLTRSPSESVKATNAKNVARAKLMKKLRDKPASTFEEDLEWVMQAVSLLELGAAKDNEFLGRAPSLRCIGLLRGAMEDTKGFVERYWKEKKTVPTGEDTSTDDGGNPSILNSFLEAHSSRPRKKRGLATGPPNPGDAADPGRQEAAG